MALSISIDTDLLTTSSLRLLNCDATVTRERLEQGMLNGKAGNHQFSEPAPKALKSNIEVYRGI